MQSPSKDFLWKICKLPVIALQRRQYRKTLYIFATLKDRTFRQRNDGYGNGGYSFISTPVLYFFVEKKTETLLCEEFVQEIQSSLGMSVFGEYKKFKALFACLMELSKNQNFTLIIDEFQEFRKINQTVFSEMQNVWDSNKNNSKMNLVICGSIYSKPKRILKYTKSSYFCIFKYTMQYGNVN